MTRQTVPYEPLSSPLPSRRDGAGLAALGAVASVGAVLAAASCCILPLALAALGLGAGLSSTFAALMPLRWPLTVLSMLGLAAGWWSYVRRRSACASDPACATRTPSRATPAILATGTLLTVVALAWDRLEIPLMQVLS